MDKKKDFLLSVVGLAILLVGAVIVSVMDYPLGLLLIPKIKKVYRNDKRESHFLRPVILCIDLRETF